MKRQQIRPFLEMVINKAHKPPTSIKVEWDESLFILGQLRTELLKMATLSGSVSPRTIMEKPASTRIKRLPGEGGG